MISQKFQNGNYLNSGGAFIKLLRTNFIAIIELVNFIGIETPHFKPLFSRVIALAKLLVEKMKLNLALNAS